MKKYSGLVLLFAIFIIGINNLSAQETYYKMPNGKIITSEKYNEVKEKLSEKGFLDEKLVSEETRNDSIIKTTKLVIMSAQSMNSPYVEFEKMIGDQFDIDAFPKIVDNQENSTYIKGKPTVLNFWFIGCAPCMQELPDLEYLYEKYSQEVNFIGITFNNSTEVDQFVKKNNIQMPQITDAKDALMQMNVNAYPMNIILNKEGKIMGVYGIIKSERPEVESLIDYSLRN